MLSLTMTVTTILSWLCGLALVFAAFILLVWLLVWVVYYAGLFCGKYFFDFISKFF